MKLQEFNERCTAAFRCGHAGEDEESLNEYNDLEQIINNDKLLQGEMWYSTPINFMRHFPVDDAWVESAKGGAVMPLEATEDMVMGINPFPCDEEKTNKGLRKTQINANKLGDNILNFGYNLGHHAHNKRNLPELPHLFVMSTGRCGSMSLYYLLKKTRHIPHHSYYYHPSATQIYEQMCRFIDGNYENDFIIQLWLQCRAAEWLWPTMINRPTAFVSHLDTIFAPVFALLHPKAKFIFLRRNPEDVFNSMITKQQWGMDQLKPIFYTLDPYFKWKSWGTDEQQVRWMLEFTDTFCRTFGEIANNTGFQQNWIEISADKLFQQDRKEIQKMIDFAELELPLNLAVKHYETKINEKAHKKI